MQHNCGYFTFDRSAYLLKLDQLCTPTTCFIWSFTALFYRRVYENLQNWHTYLHTIWSPNVSLSQQRHWWKYLKIYNSNKILFVVLYNIIFLRISNDVLFTTFWQQRATMLLRCKTIWSSICIKCIISISLCSSRVNFKECIRTCTSKRVMVDAYLPFEWPEDLRN